MKILVRNGSPKRVKSDTMHITRAFPDDMKEAALQDIHKPIILHVVPFGDMPSAVRVWGKNHFRWRQDIR